MNNIFKISIFIIFKFKIEKYKINPKHIFTYFIGNSGKFFKKKKQLIYKI